MFSRSHGAPYGSGYGKGKGGRKGSKGTSGKKGFKAPPVLANPTAPAPVLHATSSYSYVFPAEGRIDVLTPAWHCRALRRPERTPLGLAEALIPLQLPSGGFKITAFLLAAAGASETGPALAMVGSEDEEALGALLVLKAAAQFLGRGGSAWAGDAECEAMCRRCEVLVGLTPRPAELETIAARCLNLLKGRWSFFELWERLLPQEVVRPLRQRGGILCTRFFLVDLASAAWSPYEVDKKVPIFRQGDLLYVGQAPQDFESDNHDAMRQGKHLEGALVEYSEVEEEKILMALELPSGQQVIYAAAPDAFDTSVAQAEARDPLLGDRDYQQAGYSWRTAFTRDDGAECHIWSQDVHETGMKTDLTLPLSSYVEIKKTTHLNGLNGAFKLMKFWLQVALCRAGCALVGLAEGSVAPVVESFLRMTEADMEWRMKEAFDDMICERAWGALLQSLAQLLAETSDGQCLVQLWKARGFGSPVLWLTQGLWSLGSGHSEAASFRIRSRCKSRRDGALCRKPWMPSASRSVLGSFSLRKIHDSQRKTAVASLLAWSLCGQSGPEVQHWQGLFVVWGSVNLSTKPDTSGPSTSKTTLATVLGLAAVGRRAKVVARSAASTAELREAAKKNLLNNYGERQLAFMSGQGHILKEPLTPPVRVFGVLGPRNFMKGYPAQPVRVVPALIAVNCLGHSDEGWAQVVAKNASKLCHTSNLYLRLASTAYSLGPMVRSLRSGVRFEETSGANLLRGTMVTYWNEDQVRLGETLVEISFADKAFFCNSGTEANEAAIKFSRKFHFAKGAPREKFIAFESHSHVYVQNRALDLDMSSWV
eukprot:s1627_g17.t2